jgi:Fe2+ transport system protein FeoA
MEQFGKGSFQFFHAYILHQECGKSAKALIDNDSQLGYFLGVNLWEAPFHQPLKILAIENVSEELKLVLMQLGIDIGEPLEKMHVAPLGDPLSFRVGEQLFTLRKEICRKILVELA